MDYKIKSEKIFHANGKSINFEFPIKETLVIGEIIVIVVEPPIGVHYQQNVFAINSVGDFLWRIGDVELCSKKSNDCCYVGAVINSANELILYNWCDTAVIVSPQTGDVISTYQTK